MTETHIEDIAGRIEPRAASNMLLWGIVAFMIIFFIWAAFTQLERTVRGMGRVIPDSQLQIVSNLEGGVIQAILVEPGQIVNAGDELLRLDPTQSDSEFGSGEASVTALNAKIVRLKAEISGTSPAYPPVADPAALEQIAIERALHASRMAELAGMNGALRARLSQAERGVAEANAAYQARLTAREARVAELAILRPLVERGIEPRMTLMQAESAAAISASEAAAAQAMVSRAHASVAEARAALAQQGQDWRARAATELAAAQAELSSRRRMMPALAGRLERTVLRAPLSGKVNRVLATTVGGSVGPGQPLIEIVPAEENLLIEARVRPEDIGTIRIGQEAKVSITAYDSSVHGRLDGRVLNISPDAMTDENTGESYYMIRVRTDSNALADGQGRPLQIGPGMTAEVSLIGDKRSVLRYILTPITRLSETAFRE